MSAHEVWNMNDSETCVVCFKTVEYYSIGICDHPVCFECSTRMRVLCRQNECPICRQDMPKVMFCTQIALFRCLKAELEHTRFVDNKFGIWFETSDIQKAYNHLLEYTCTKCSKPEHFKTFLQVKEHFRKIHELHYCDLCVEHLRIFPWERKCYTRSELAQHRRKGDADDTSHRGHPLCEFCDTRYMDGDDLFRHLRREHLFCHFCDADGLHQYYSSYEFLRQHFQIEHYLCEEGECINEKFTSVFRTDIDMKAHRAQMHGKQLGKVATKQARTLELEFTLKPRNGPKMPAHMMGGAAPPSGRSEVYIPYMDVLPLQPTLDITGQDFPSLGGSFGSTSLPPRPITSGGNVTVRHITRGQKGLARTNENFPALSSDSSTVRLSVNSSTVGPQESLQTTTTTNAQNVSIHVNHRTNGAITTHISQNQSNAVRVRPRTDAFPALGAVTVQEAQWVKQGASKEHKPKATKVASAPVLPTRNSQMDFPELSTAKQENKPKKTSSLTMPVSTAWVTEQPEHRELKNNKGKKKKSKHTLTNPNSPSNTASELNVNQSYKTTSASENKPNAAKKKETPSQQTQRPQVQTRPQSHPQAEKQVPPNKQNGVIKKRSELKIDSLHISEPRVNNGDRNDFPSLCVSKPPPGIAVQAPPGFAANDLTFTNSSGQSYSILPPTHFTAPPNFPQRNQKLIESFMISSTNDDIMEFKTLSSLFRSGVYSAEEYYRNCKSIMQDNFTRVFPELLVLLPDIDKQQELYAIHAKETGTKRGLEVCATCGQVVSTGDLRSHLASHRMDNHFPALGSQEIPSVWKKP